MLCSTKCCQSLLPITDGGIKLMVKNPLYEHVIAAYGIAMVGIPSQMPAMVVP